MFAREWQQRHVPRALDRLGDGSLLLGRYACLAARADLASLGDE